MSHKEIRSMLIMRLSILFKLLQMIKVQVILRISLELRESKLKREMLGDTEEVK